MTVTLTDGAGVSVTDANGVAVDHKPHPMAGKYLFINLKPGTYKATFLGHRQEATPQQPIPE